MRLLVDFVWENPEVPEGDSSWVWSRDMAKAATEAGHFVHWVTPTTGGDGVTSRVERLPAMMQARNAEAILAPSVVERWSSLLEPIDVVVTNNPVRGMVIGHWLDMMGKGQGHVPVLVWNVSVKYAGADDVPNYGPRDLAIWALGYALHPNVQPTQFALERARDAVRAYAGPSMVTMYDDTATVVYVGPNCDLVDEVKAEKFDRFSLYFGGRFTATKGGEDVVETYLQYLMGGRTETDAYVTVIGNGQRLDALLNKWDAGSLLQLRKNLGYRQAIELMSRCHVSIFWQSLKVFPSAPLEQIYAGLVVMVRRDEHTAEFLPVDYPFLFEGKAEAGAMLRWIAEHYEEALEKMAPYPAFVRERYDRKTNVARVLGQAEALYEAEKARLIAGHSDLESTRSLLTRAIEMGGTPARLSTVLEVLHRIRPQLLRMNTTGRGLLLNDVLKLIPPEYVDTYEEAEPVYVLKETTDGDRGGSHEVAAGDRVHRVAAQVRGGA
jgi:hypothetical protein